MNTVCEDAGELASNAVEVDLLKRRANSRVLAAEDRLEPGPTVHEAASSHFLGVEGASVSFGKGSARVFALRDVSLMFERGTLSLVMVLRGAGRQRCCRCLAACCPPTKDRCSWMMSQ